MTRAALVLVLFAAALHAQRPTGAIAGRIVSNEGGLPLPYSIVALPDLGRERFTDDSGSFLLTDLPAGPARVRVRRLGYSPMELTFPVRAGVTDTLRVVLTRVPIRMAAVQIREIGEYPPCRRPGAPDPTRDSVLAMAFEQLRMNAEQYRTLSHAYPFAYDMDVTIARETRSGSRREKIRDTVRESSTERPAYRTGRVVTRARGKMRRFAPYEFHTPELPDITSDEFVRTHCFHHGRVVEGDEPLIQIEVRAAERLRDADVEGSIMLNAETFQIRRTVFRLHRVPPWPDLRGMLGQEVTTEFREILPSIPVVHRAVSIQRFDRRDPEVTWVAVHETQRLVQFEFLGPRPGEEKRP